MTSVLTNKRIDVSVVERVPCSFAPLTKQGTIGSHYVMVLLSKDQGELSIKYVGCECQELHGEGIQALHELGGKNDTCYAATVPFRNIACSINQADPTNLLSIIDDAPEECTLPPALKTMFDVVWRDGCIKHNRRWHLKAEYNPTREQRQADALARTANHVLCSLLNVPGKSPDLAWRGGGDVGPFPEQLIMNQVDYPPVFLMDDVVDNQFVLVTAVGYQALATRSHGQWTLEEDKIKLWASDTYGIVVPGVKFDPHQCMFCNEHFDRMSKHTNGARHIDRVTDVFKMVCKATSRVGLQMLNDPRRRSVFIKR